MNFCRRVLGLALGLQMAGALPASAPDAPRAQSAGAASATTGDGLPEAVDALRALAARQKAVLAEARALEDASEAEDMRPQLQKIVDGYEALLTRHPDFAAAWAAYGLFLCEPVVEERRAALALLLRANRLDPNLAVVKNQIGVLLAEDGRVTDALNYFLAAGELEPTEPLYPFQVGLLLDESRAELVKTNAWRGDVLEQTMLAAFARAVALAPERTDFAYRAAEAYYTLTEPRWDEAYAVWSALEERLTGALEVETVRLHRARVRWKQGLAGDARELLTAVKEPALAGQRAKLEAEFAAEDAAEAAAGASR